MEDLRKELISTMNEYIDLLTSELDEVAPIAALHHWKSTRFKEGEVLRNKMTEIRMKILDAPVFNENKEMVTYKELKEAFDAGMDYQYALTHYDKQVGFTEWFNSHKK